MSNEITRKCKHHGDTIFFKNGRSYRCRACWNEKVIVKRVALKMRMVEFAGGCCTRCGFNRSFVALDFHHIDPQSKSFPLSSGYCYSWDRVVEEMNKCELLCANCHRELHFSHSHSISGSL